MKKLIIYSLTLLGTTATLQGQNVYFSFTDGTEQSYALLDVRKKTFGVDVMDFQLTNGTIYSWQLDEIENFSFSDQVGIGELDEESLAPIKIYPNPTSGRISVEYALKAESQVRLEILDLNGRRCRLLELGTQTVGNHIAYWDGTDAEGRPAVAGTYLCRIITPLLQISRTFIIQ